MNLIYYNSFAEHMRKTYTSDCSIYLESRGVMELMAGAEPPGTVAGAVPWVHRAKVHRFGKPAAADGNGECFFSICFLHQSGAKEIACCAFDRTP